MVHPPPVSSVFLTTKFLALKVRARNEANCSKLHLPDLHLCMCSPTQTLRWNFGIAVLFGQEITTPLSHPHGSSTAQDHSLSSCTSVLTSRTNYTSLFVGQSQYLLGQDSQMRLGSRPQGNLTTGATGPFPSLTGQTSSDCRENSLYKDNSFHSSAQFSQILIFFPSLSFPSKKLFGKDVFLFKRRLTTLLLTIDIFLFILHCLPATRCSLNILPLEERTS